MHASPITPAERFTAHDRKVAAERKLDWATAKVWRSAHHWESFPGSYTAEQVAAAEALLRSPDSAEAFATVAGLA